MRNQDNIIVTPAEQFTSQHDDMLTQLLLSDDRVAKPTAPPLTADIPVATIIYDDDDDGMVPPAISTKEEEIDRSDISSTSTSSNNNDIEYSGRECITKYPEAYQIRCACCEVGAETFDCEMNLLVCFSYFLNLDFACSSLEMDDKCARIQLCCLACKIDPHRCCCVQCKKEDCVGCSTDNGNTPIALQCFCLHTGFLLKDCTKLDCFRFRVGCFKCELDNNFQSYQLCCVRCGEKEKVTELPASMRRGFVGQ